MVDQIRKPITDEVNDSDDENKKIKTLEMGNAKPSGRGSRGRGRGRGRGGRAARTSEIESLNHEPETETAMMGPPPPPQDCIKMHVTEDSSPQENEKKDVDDIAASNEDSKQHIQIPKEGIDFDLNAESIDLNETKLVPSSTAASATASANATVTPAEEYPGWSTMDMSKIDPLQLASMSKRIDEDEEDYDEEG